MKILNIKQNGQNIEIYGGDDFIKNNVGAFFTITPATIITLDTESRELIAKYDQNLLQTLTNIQKMLVAKLPQKIITATNHIKDATKHSILFQYELLESLKK